MRLGLNGFVGRLVGTCSLRAVAGQIAGPHASAGMRAFRELLHARDGLAALEFALLVPPMLLLIFGFVSAGCLVFTWSTMQNSAQYAAQLVSTGQVTALSSGAITTTNNTATTACSSSLTSSDAEYYVCNSLPGAGSGFTVTTTENCSVPSVTVNVSANGSTAALADLLKLFSGLTITAQSVVMKSGACP